MVKLLLACPAKGWFEPMERAQTTDALREHAETAPNRVTDAMNRVVDAIGGEVDEITRRAARRVLEKVEW